MNKLTIKHFFAILLASLLIIAMFLMQLPFAEKKLIYFIGLIVVLAAIVFILYYVTKISTRLYKALNCLQKIEKNQPLESKNQDQADKKE